MIRLISCTKFKNIVIFGSVASFAVNGRWFLLLTFVRKRSKLITDICQKGDAYAKTDTMPENRKNACLPQLLTG